VTENERNEKVFSIKKKSISLEKCKRGITTIYFWFLTNDVYKTVPLHIFLEDIYMQNAGTPFSQQIVPCNTRNRGS